MSLPSTDYLQMRSPHPSLPQADHYITIKSSPDHDYIDWIIRGKKLAEGRVYTEPFRKIKTNEKLCLYNKCRYVLCEVLYKHTYHSFRDMLLAEGVKTMLPYARDLESAVRVYKRFPGAQRADRLGVVAIGIRPLCDGGS